MNEPADINPWVVIETESYRPNPSKTSIPLYTHPASKPMTERDIERLHFIHAKCQEEDMKSSGWIEFARAVELQHGIGK